MKAIVTVLATALLAATPLAIYDRSTDARNRGTETKANQGTGEDQTRSSVSPTDTPAFASDVRAAEPHVPQRQLAATPPRVRIGQPAFYSAKCHDAYTAVRWYRRAYNQHRTTLGQPLAPRLETGMACPRLRERAAYWIWAAQINRKAAARITARHAEVAHKLNRGLAGTPMAGTGTELEAAGREHGIHPAFIAAIAATESSFGAAMCGHYNAYGLGNCTGIWDVPAFTSWGDSYRFMGRFLSGRWPHADTPWEFYGYAACDSCWGNRVAFYMGRLGFGHGVRYR